MDNGAHYFRTDFQIHTPRDEHWHGGDATSHSDRLAYAREFVGLCRERGLHAVAITDHHDMCLVPYVQAAAQNHEFNPEADFQALPAEQKPLVFPGMELTVRQGCQVIVLLDPQSSLQTQELLHNTLCGTHSQPDGSKGPEVHQLAFSSPADLNQRLRETAGLNGKYLLLPNVNEGGQHTWLRDGFSQIYATMPCVGAYVDGRLGEHRHLHWIEGKDHNWGNKAVAVFQTSDFRGWGMLPDQVEEQDPADTTRRPLGSCFTWAKLGDPTIEAVRQACLGRQSRLRQTDPVLPNTFIERVEVTDSGFLGPIDLALNPQFNALIGGRGTGKTSILEYIRYAMQDQPRDLDDPKLHDEIAQKRDRIILETLLSKNGTVTVHWIKNRVRHLVRLGGSAKSPTLQIGTDEPQDVSAEELRAILPLQAYSQKQLSTVGTRTQELQRLIKQPLQERLSAQAEQISEKRRRAEQLYDQVVELKDRSRTLGIKRRELKSVQEQAKSTEESLPELADDLQKALKENPLRLKEKQVVERFRTEITTVEDTVAAALKGLANMPHALSLDDESPQRASLLEVHDMLERLFDKVRAALRDVQSDVTTDSRSILDKMDEWQGGQESHEELYRKAEEEAKEHRDKLALIKSLRGQEAIIQKDIEGLEESVSALPSLEEDFRGTWAEWVKLHKGRGDILEEACAQLSAKSEGEIEVELRRGADFTRALESLSGILQGCSIREANWTAFRDYLNTDNPADAWMKLMEQLRPLAELKEEDLAGDESVPEVPSWDLTPGMRRRIVGKLSPARRWLDIALTSLEDLPVFYFHPREGERIDFRNASAGQQATALLKVLLAESSGPLMIDQPEEDLDNAIIQEITEVIWDAKTRRQLIFASHNANIVVNGDAELVVHCAYREEGDRTKGYTAAEGAIDRPQIRDAIETVIEGGKQAFELRRQKYGF